MYLENIPEQNPASFQCKQNVLRSRQAVFVFSGEIVVVNVLSRSSGRTIGQNVTKGLTENDGSVEVGMCIVSLTSGSKQKPQDRALKNKSRFD